MNKNSIIAALVVVATIAVGILVSFSGDTGKKAVAPPKDTKAQLVREDAYYKGKKDAKVAIVEFADFQCPACKLSAPTMDEVVNFYGDKVVIYYRHFPLPQHRFAFGAAEAAEAAGLQGKFWEMHDLIYANQSSLHDGSFSAFAKNLGFDLTKFETDRKSEVIADKVSKDKSDAEKLGVNSTPTFFVNDEKVEGGGLTLDDWKKIIDEKIKQ